MSDEKIREYQRQYYLENRERLLEYQKEYRERNIEKVRESERNSQRKRRKNQTEEEKEQIRLYNIWYHRNIRSKKLKEKANNKQEIKGKE